MVNLLVVNLFGKEIPDQLFVKYIVALVLAILILIELIILLAGNKPQASGYMGGVMGPQAFLPGMMTINNQMPALTAPMGGSNALGNNRENLTINLLGLPSGTSATVDTSAEVLSDPVPANNGTSNIYGGNPYGNTTINNYSSTANSMDYDDDFDDTLGGNLVEMSPRSTLKENFAELDWEQKNFMVRIIDHALTKPTASDSLGMYAWQVKALASPILKVTIRNNKVVTKFKIENDLIKAFRKQSSKENSTKVKIKETTVVLTDVDAFVTARGLVDVMFEQAKENAVNSRGEKYVTKVLQAASFKVKSPKYKDNDEFVDLAKEWESMTPMDRIKNSRRFPDVEIPNFVESSTETTTSYNGSASFSNMMLDNNVVEMSQSEPVSYSYAPSYSDAPHTNYSSSIENELPPIEPHKFASTNSRDYKLKTLAVDIQDLMKDLISAKQKLSKAEINVDKVSKECEKMLRKAKPNNMGEVQARVDKLTYDANSQVVSAKAELTRIENGLMIYESEWICEYAYCKDYRTNKVLSFSQMREIGNNKANDERVLRKKRIAELQVEIKQAENMFGQATYNANRFESNLFNIQRWASMVVSQATTVQAKMQVEEQVKQRLVMAQNQVMVARNDVLQRQEQLNALKDELNELKSRK